MTLFSSLGTALSGLEATMAALQTTGNNIANASTPGYSRQIVDLSPAPPLDQLPVQIGSGVQVTGVTQVVDQALEGELRNSDSSLASLGATNDTLTQLQGLFAALSGSDLGTQIDTLFKSLQNFSLNPQDTSARQQVLSSATTVAQTINQLDQGIQNSRQQINTSVQLTVDDINKLSTQIAQLNNQIVSTENDGLDFGSANNLRDQRNQLLRQLSQDVKIQSVETSNGDVNVLVGSSFLVFGTQSFAVTTQKTADDGVEMVNPVFANGSVPVPATGGKLQGLLSSRDQILGQAHQNLNILANALAFEFNRVQSTGQGLTRFGDLTSLQSVPDPSATLAISGKTTANSTLDTLTDASLIGSSDPTGRSITLLSGADNQETRQITGFDPATGTIFLDRPMPHPLAIGDQYQITDLPFPVENGSFDVVVTNESTGLSQSTPIQVNLTGVGPQTTWSDVVAQLGAVPNLKATLTNENRIRIQSTDANQTFSFANDTSGFLAAAGLNAFFSGSQASDLAVNPALAPSPSLLSGAQSNNPGDNTNALAFTALQNLAAVNGTSTFDEFYQSLVGNIGVQTSQSHDQLQSQTLQSQQLENQRQQVSGVNVDEEAVNMIEFQRTFQGSARFITAIDTLLNTLVTMV
jgi:flagellar hook-associated protein 1 FlgK